VATTHTGVVPRAGSLISVAGLVGRAVRNPVGGVVGRVRDVLARWSGATYPEVTGLVVRVGRRDAFVPAAAVASLAGPSVELRSARLDLADVQRRPGEVFLMADVVDHQLVDVDGRRVIRAADLYLAPMTPWLRLVGADVSAAALARRLGPSRWRQRRDPSRVIDWAAIQPFGRPGEPLRLREGNRAVDRLRPSELADLLEDLGRQQRHELLAALEPGTAADALEEMEPKELVTLLRAAPVEQAAALLAAMEPDGATEALRDLEGDLAETLLEQMPPPRAAALHELLGYGPGVAGGLMTSELSLVHLTDSVGEVRRRLRLEVDRAAEVDAVLVVDHMGRVVDDVRLLQILVADDHQTMAELVGPPLPAVVEADRPLHDVLVAFREARGSSVVVVDADDRPVGKIMADDLVDALAARTSRLRGWTT
jgi:hypothetical protein